METLKLDGFLFEVLVFSGKGGFPETFLKATKSKRNFILEFFCIWQDLNSVTSIEEKINSKDIELSYFEIIIPEHV